MMRSMTGGCSHSIGEVNCVGSGDPQPSRSGSGDVLREDGGRGSTVLGSIPWHPPLVQASSKVAS